MSASNEKIEAPARVTRSMRRLNSESESVDLENRPETPTNRIRKKFDDNDAVMTPKRTTRASSATRSLLEEQVIASPLRRTTRRMSSDRAIDSPIRATRSTRRSNQNLNESDDESVVFVSEQPATPRTLKSSRKTLVKLEEVVEEETDTNFKLNTSEISNIDKLNTSDNSNDLELRNRSISKSPNVQLSPNKNGKNTMSLSDELKAADLVNGNNHQVFDYNNENLNESKDSITDEMNKEPRDLSGLPKDTVEEKDSVEPSNDVENTENEQATPTQPQQIEEQQTDINEQDEKINDNAENEIKEVETNEDEKNPHDTEISQKKSQDHVVPIETVAENSNNTLEPKGIDENVNDMIETSQAGDLTDTSLRVEVRMTEKHEVIEYQVNDMMNDFVADTSNAEIQNVSTTIRDINIEIECSSLPSVEAAKKSSQKSPQKSPRKSNNWSTTVVGTSDRIDVFATPPAEEPIKAPTPKKTKIISSDEDEEEEEDGRNSLIDDEAMEVGSDEESMTKSERDYMEQNEIVEDGESLGSEDSNVNEIQSNSEHESNDSFIVDDDVEEQYDMNSSEEQIEEIERSKRKSRIIQQSSSEDENEQEVAYSEESEKEKSISPSKSATPQKTPVREKSATPQQSLAKEKSVTPQQSPVKEKSATPQQSPEKSASSPEKSPQKSAKKTVNIETLKDSMKRISTRHSLPLQTAIGSSKKSRNSIPSSWTIEDNNDDNVVEEKVEEMQTVNERKRKRESVVHGAVPKRFKEMSPNESEAVHMENVEEIRETPKQPTSTKKSKKSKEIPEADIAKVLDRCEEHLMKYNAEKKAKLALKRKKIEEKKLKKAQKGETNVVEGSPGSDNKENSLEKKKKKKQKAKKQPLVAEVDTEKEDMATKLTKRQEKLAQKREKKRKKKEIKAPSDNSGVESMEVDDQSPVVVKKKKSQKTTEQLVEKKKVLGETKQKKQAESMPEKKSKKQHEELPVVVKEHKPKKRRLNESEDEDIIERPNAKKKLNILQQVDDHQKPRSHDIQKQVKLPEFVLPTVTKKLKTVIPKGLDKEQPKKMMKKKGNGKVIPEPRISLPRPVWTSSGMFIEESIEPYKFKTTEYKPINASNASTQFRVIPFEAKAKKAVAKDPRMELLLKRNKKSRDKTMRNMKNLM